MKNKSKKLKAAITGLIYYLQQEDENRNKQNGQWSRTGREIMMRNRSMVQSRGIKRL